MSRMLLMILLSLVVILPSCSTSDSRAEKMYEQAGRLIDEDKVPEAVQILEDLVRMYPETPAASKAKKDLPLYRGVAGAVDRYPVVTTKETMTATARQIEKYRMRYGKFPKKLDDFLPQKPLDYWGNRIKYTVADNRRKYTLVSYGADGLPGGEGDGADMVIRDGEFVNIPRGTSE